MRGTVNRGWPNTNSLIPLYLLQPTPSIRNSAIHISIAKDLNIICDFSSFVLSYLLSYILLHHFSISRQYPHQSSNMGGISQDQLELGAQKIKEFFGEKHASELRSPAVGSQICSPLHVVLTTGVGKGADPWSRSYRRPTSSSRRRKNSSRESASPGTTDQVSPSENVR